MKTSPDSAILCAEVLGRSCESPELSPEMQRVWALAGLWGSGVGPVGSLGRGAGASSTGRLRESLTVDLAASTLPRLRQEYVSAVEGLAARVPSMRQAGMSSEQIARVLHAERRGIGDQFKALTPPGNLAEITQRDIQRYGDPRGPSIDWLRARGKTWEQIIESASRTGGRDLGF